MMTPGPFHLHRLHETVCVTKAENSHLDLNEVVNLRWILAAFHGPDREANARAFLALPELVEALNKAKENTLMISTRCLELGVVHRELQLLAIGAVNEIDAALAKMEGTK